MKRWNGWGLETTNYPLAPEGARFLKTQLGNGAPPRDAQLGDVLRTVPTSRLPAHPLVSTAPEARAGHARGQSLPDWIALRSGRVGVFPDGVAFPTSPGEVRALIDYAGAMGARLI